VEGVRPITLYLHLGWRVRRAEGGLSITPLNAQGVLDRANRWTLIYRLPTVVFLAPWRVEMPGLLQPRAEPRM
jgi:hypothetical protein